jgi:hypothetical protein
MTTVINVEGENTTINITADNVTIIVPPDVTPPEPPPLDVPLPARAVGYLRHTFECKKFDATNVDVANTKAPGFQWYPYNIFSSKPPLTDLQLNADGTITLLGANTGPNGEIVSITPDGSPEGFRGTAFGGGAYFTARFSFDPALTVLANGWPAWWSLCMEATIPALYNQWSGQDAGYRHAIENDFFEYDLYQPSGSNYTVNQFAAAMHDYWGVYNVTCTQYCRVNTGALVATVPEGTDFTKPHDYGCLWVPATDTAPGFSEYFFDELPVSRKEWQLFVNDGVQAPPVTKDLPWFCGVQDTVHPFLILGTAKSGGQPMTVYSVDVYQAHTDANLTN